MGAESIRPAVPEYKGRVGVWRSVHDTEPALAVAIEELGYASLWLGRSPTDDLLVAQELLGATSRITIATGVVNIWRSDPAVLAHSFHRIDRQYPQRFVLGIGVGHPERSGPIARRPYTAMVGFLDVLEREGVPSQSIVLAALGPRMLRLAASRTGGAHPYLTPPAHTALARDALGPGPMLVAEQRVILGTDTARMRAIARADIRRYLELTNYRNNLMRSGFDESDLDGEGSDKLIDGLVAYGAPTRAAERVAAHLGAGASEVVVQVLADAGEKAEDAYTQLAEEMSLRG